MGKVTKQFSVRQLATRKDGGRILISTPAVDRDKDRVIASGVKTDNYLRNPVVQWGHSYEEPWQTVGRTTKLEVTPDGIVADFELRPAANDQDPQNIVRLLWEQGYIKAASIGFIPTKSAPNKDGGNDFTESELLEWSLVPIPANQTALRLSMKTAKQKSMLGRALLIKSPDYRLPDETPEACSARKVPELMDANPGMTEEEARAMAAEICAQEAPPPDQPAPDAPPPPDAQQNAKDATSDMMAAVELLSTGLEQAHAALEALQAMLEQPQPAPDAPAPDAPPPPDQPAQPAQASKDIAKRGRVLSAGNEGKLRTAHGAIGEVLSQLGEAAPEQAAPANDSEKAKAEKFAKELAAMLGDLKPLILK